MFTATVAAACLAVSLPGPGSQPVQAEESDECGPGETWSCKEVENGQDDGYLPDDFDADEKTEAEDLREIIKKYGETNPDFDVDEAEKQIKKEKGRVTRGEMFNVIAAGLDLEHDPDDGYEAVDPLGDRNIVRGRDGDATDTDREDADADADLSNAALAALLDRIKNEAKNNPDPAPTPTYRPSRPSTTSCGSGTHRHSSSGSCHAHPDPGCTTSGTYRAISGSGHTFRATSVCEPELPDCAASVAVTAQQRRSFAAQLRWKTLVGIEATGEPGVRWPPHPDVPGGSDWLIVADSPVWPLLDSGADWEIIDQDGCVWVTTHLETSVIQMLPWRSSHRRIVEQADADRPAAGFDVYLQRWDNLSPTERSGAQRNHVARDIDVRCGFDTAGVDSDSYDECRWELPGPGVWRWEAAACFETTSGEETERDCVTLAVGVEWFLTINDYTQQLTIQATEPAAAGGDADVRHAAVPA